MKHNFLPRCVLYLILALLDQRTMRWINSAHDWYEKIPLQKKFWSVSQMAVKCGKHWKHSEINQCSAFANSFGNGIIFNYFSYRIIAFLKLCSNYFCHFTYLLLVRETKVTWKLNLWPPSLSLHVIFSLDIETLKTFFIHFYKHPHSALHSNLRTICMPIFQ